MGWKGSKVNIYLNKETREEIENKLDHLQENYDGPSDFFKKKLRQEEVLSVEEKLELLDKEIEEKKKQRQKYEQIKNERKMQKRLQNKKSILREKQKQLKKIEEQGFRSEDEIRSDVRERLEAAGFDVDGSDRDYFEDKVESLLSDRPDVSPEELREQIVSLQEEISDLGDTQDWFMEVQA